MSEQVLHGGCLCGAVRYQIFGTPQTAEHCHCSMCRKAHGTAFSSNAVVESSKFVITAGAEWITEYNSSPNRLKCFCRQCGSQLFIRRMGKPELIVVTLGTFDADPMVRAKRHVFVASKAAWYTILDDLPQYKVYPGLEPNEKLASSEEP